jgi:hypothetical protein
MTQRERQASGGREVATAAPPRSPAATAAPLHAASGPQGPDPAPPWEDLYQNASPQQQEELLALAGRQGVLYGHQLPPAAGNGTPTSTEGRQAGSSEGGQAGAPGRPLLGRLLAGGDPDLEPVRPLPVGVHDTGLDPAQREAVARALQTPDVCLIQGAHGTGKSRVVAEIITQAAARGERVLFLAPHADAIDVVLAALAGRETVCPVRCLERAERENPELIPAAARAFTLEGRVRRLQEETLPRARQEGDAADQDHQQHQGEAPLWERLRELAEQHGQLRQQLDTLREDRTGVPARVAADADQADPACRPSVLDESGAAGTDFAAAVRRCRDTLAAEQARLGAARTALQQQTDERRREQEATEARLRGLLPLAEAKEHKRWWTGAWWRAAFHGNVPAQVTELKGRLEQGQTALEGLEQQGRRLDEEEQTALGQFTTARSLLLDAETARRLQQLDQQESALRQDERHLQEKWQAACAGLRPDSPRPAEPSVGAVAAAHARWQEHLQQVARRGAFARRWAACLEEMGGSYPARLLGLCNVVAATTSALPADEHFGELSTSTEGRQAGSTEGRQAGSTEGRQAGPLVHFDLLVLEEADQVTESELLNLARRARRWVLVGLPGSERGTRAPERKTSSPLRGPRPALGPAPRVFGRLWQRLHCDPSRLPSSWVQEKDRLTCRLRPLPPEQAQWLETERLADFPDVELRILAAPRTSPQLVEVVFPASMSVDEAKGYLFRELEELPVHAPGHSLRWVEEPDRLVLRLSDQPLPGARPVALDAGVSECVAGAEPCPETGSVRWQTCCLAFDRGAGWQRPQAEEWVRQHLGLRDLGRTARLDMPHRMAPDLAGFLGELLHQDGVCPAAKAVALGEDLLASLRGGGPAVEFVAVPSLQEGDRRPEASGGRSRGRSQTATLTRPQVAAPPRKGGAGLELELTDVRHRDRLPGELRGDLPDRGLVNYREARAVVSTLEGLAGDPAFVAAVRAGGVAVVALYPAQAQLIRVLVRQSPTLSAADLPVTIDVPEGFRQHEALVVLVSLTRSHTHRAVNFGGGPHDLLLALTRARGRLVLFGDPGTLARRCQWEGPLEHLDEAASQRERDVIEHLVRYLHGQGPHPGAFHLSPGGSSPQESGSA